MLFIFFGTAKWILDSSIFSSIKPKHDKRLFTWIYLFCAEKLSEHQNNTIFGAQQVNLG